VIQERKEELKKRAEERKKVPRATEDQDINAYGNDIATNKHSSVDYVLKSWH
jgi:hypothetical protein